MADEKVIWQMLARYGIKDIKELAEAIRRLEPIDLGFATKGGVPLCSVLYQEKGEADWT